MSGLLSRLLRLLLLLLASSLQANLIVASAPHEKGAGSEIPRGPAPHTMLQHEAPLPLLQTKTLFVVDNEPVIESHIVSNLLHQLLFSVGVPQQHVRLRDESYILGSRQTRIDAASLGRWLAAEAEAIPEGLEFVFICTAYTRIDPRTLETLLTELRKGRSTPLDPFILGWGLVDEKPTIIHHFATAKSQVYPDLDAGTVWSRAAFLALKKAITDTPPAPGIERDFVYELFAHLKKTQQLQLLHSELFCPLTPSIENYERAHTAYPAPHTRPQKPAGSEASAAANQRELTPAEKRAQAIAAGVASVHKGCIAFSSGNRHAPVLSHQMFDALIDFDEELLIKREELENSYAADDKTITGGPYQKALEELEKSRPAFIVEPQDLMVAIKTHAGNHTTRLPLLRRLWASQDALLLQAKKHSGHAHHAQAFVSKEEQRQLKESYEALSLRFFSDTPDLKRGIEALAIKGAPEGAPIQGKGGLCLRLQQIFREFLLTPELRRFLVVTDDDTLLNFRHLMDLLSLTLQPTIPARGFVANLLSDEQGYRAHNPRYKALATEIRNHLQARAAEADAVDDCKGKQQAPEALRYTPEQLTGASSVYGCGPHRPLEAVSPLYLGERYAFSLTGEGGKRGYEYVTMGGGVVLDRNAVQLLVKCADAGKCNCPPDGTADDMMLGIWAKHLNIPLTHARGLHQEKPADYHRLLIETITPVSFHRMQQSIKDTKRIFSEYVDIGEYSKGADGEVPLSPDDLLEVDWIDHDWHHVEEHLWIEREELHEIGEDDPLLPKGIGDILNRKVARGTRPMTPEELLEHDELEEGGHFHDEL